MIDFTRPTAHPRARAFRWLSVTALGLYLVLLAYLSLIPSVPSDHNVSDKLLHFLAYGGLTGLAAAAWPRLGLVKLFLSVSVVGVLLEIGQGLMAVGRAASFGDQLANMSGAALAIAIWVSLKFVYEKVF